MRPSGAVVAHVRVVSASPSRFGGASRAPPPACQRGVRTRHIVAVMELRVESRMENGVVPQLITVTEAAERLGLSRSKMYELLAAGEMPSVRIGRTRRIDTEDLVAFVEQHRQPALQGFASELSADS